VFVVTMNLVKMVRPDKFSGNKFVIGFLVALMGFLMWWLNRR
jgi:hypothetical protein